MKVFVYEPSLGCAEGAKLARLARTTHNVEKSSLFGFSHRVSNNRFITSVPQNPGWHPIMAPITPNFDLEDRKH
jgi:hypothetical protein